MMAAVMKQVDIRTHCKVCGHAEPFDIRDGGFIPGYWYFEDSWISFPQCCHDGPKNMVQAVPPDSIAANDCIEGTRLERPLEDE